MPSTSGAGAPRSSSIVALWMKTLVLSKAPVNQLLTRSQKGHAMMTEPRPEPMPCAVKIGPHLYARHTMTSQMK